jgi:hypothetical protein
MQENEQIVCLLKIALQKGEYSNCIDKINWRQISNLIIVNGLAPFFYSKKENFKTYFVDFPEEIFYKEFIKTHLRFTRITSFFQELKSELKEQNIEMGVLKGYANALYLYDNPALRPFGDIDIIVKREDALKVYNLLISKFKFTSCDLNPESKIAYDKSFSPIYKDDLVIDLHWTLSYKEFDDSFYNFSKLKLIAPLFYKLNGETEFLYNILHFLKHLLNLKFKLVWLLDLLILCDKHSNIDLIRNIDQFSFSKKLAHSFLAFLNINFDYKFDGVKQSELIFEEMLYSTIERSDNLKLKYFYFTKNPINRIFISIYPRKDQLNILYPEKINRTFVQRIMRIKDLIIRLFIALRRN